MPQLWLILNTNGQRATGNGHWATDSLSQKSTIRATSTPHTTCLQSTKIKKKGGDGVEEAAAANSTPPPTVNLQLGGAVVHSVVLWNCSHGLPDF